MLLNLNNLEKKINIKFKNIKLLANSITHKSYSSSNNYEKLEFLGDRVLGLIISKKLLEKFPNEKEGILDKKLASLVNKKKCFEVAKSFNLEKFVLIANNKKNKVKIESKIISDCCEALIGAIFLDQGIEMAEKFILKLWHEHLNSSDITFIDAKTKLQEYSLKKYKTLPVYKLIENTGPNHNPTFKVAVKIKNSKFVKGTGKSKKEAQQNAADLFLNKIGK
jgi:ribonuclease-3